MPIEVKCSTCGATLPAPDEFAGRKIRCADCQAIVDVPAAAGSPPPLPVAAPVRPVREDRDDDESPSRRRDDDEQDRPNRKSKKEWDEEDRDNRPAPKTQVLAGGAVGWLLLLGLLSLAGLALIGMALIPIKG